jgi:uncharacterized protein
MIRFALTLMAATASIPAFAQTTSDCAKLSAPVDKAICSDPALSDLDKAMRLSFTKARARVDSDALKALEKDQKDFLSERALVFENRSMPLDSYMTNRLSFLDGLENPAWSRDATAFLGTWRNSLGEVRISKDETGKLVVAISTLSPAESKWICDIEGSGTPKNGKLEFSEDDVKITVSRRGSALVVGDQLPQGDGGRPFCGANGYIDGAFFKMK